MDKYFRTENGERINCIEHTLDIINKEPHCSIRVGTDSQNYGNVTRYVTV